MISFPASAFAISAFDRVQSCMLSGNGGVRIEQVLVAAEEPEADRLGRRAQRSAARRAARPAEYARFRNEVGTGRPRPCAVIFPGAPAQRRIVRATAD